MSTSNLNNVNQPIANLANRVGNFRNHHNKQQTIFNKANEERVQAERQETLNLHQQYVANSNTGSKSKAKNASGGQTARGVKRNYNQANNLNSGAPNNPANNHQSINGSSCNGTMLNGNTNGNLNSNNLNGGGGGGPMQISNGNLKAMGKLDEHPNQVQINGKTAGHNHLPPPNNLGARNKSLMGANEIKKELPEPATYISIKNLKDEDLNELNETCKDESYDNHLLDDLSDGLNDEFVTKFLEDIGTMTTSNDATMPHHNGYGGPPQPALCNGSSPINNQNANAAYYGNSMGSMNVNKNSSLSNVHSMQQQPNNNQHQLPPPPPAVQQQQQQQAGYTNGQVAAMGGQVGPMNGQMKLVANNNKAAQMKPIGSNQQILMVNVPNQSPMSQSPMGQPPMSQSPMGQSPMNQSQMNQSQMSHQMMASQPMLHNNQNATAHHLHHPQQTVSPIASSINPNQQLNQSLNSNLNQQPMNQMPPQPSNHHIQPGGMPAGPPQVQQQVQMQNSQPQQFNPNLPYQQNVQRINYQTQSQQANGMPNNGQYNPSPISQQQQQQPQQHHPHMQSHPHVQSRMMQQAAPATLNSNQMTMNGGQMNGGQMNSQMANQLSNGQMTGPMNGNQLTAGQPQSQQPQQYSNPNLQQQQQQQYQPGVQYMQQQPQHSYANQPPPQQNMQFSQQQQQQPPPQHSHHNMNHNMPTNSMPPNNLPNNNRILISNQPLQPSQPMNGPQYATQTMNGPPPAKRSTTPMNSMNGMPNGMMIQSAGPPQSNQMYSNY